MELMVTLHIEHRITDYDTWRTAFDRFDDARRTAGVVDQRVARPVDDDRYIVVSLDFESAERAESFLHFLRTHVWSTATNSPGLDGPPRAVVLREEVVQAPQ